MARRLVDRQAGGDADYVAALIPALRETGAVVAVAGVGDEAQTAWWRDAGADLATGPCFGPDRTADEFRSAFLS